jgi:hypothetical protein
MTGWTGVSLVIGIHLPRSRPTRFRVQGQGAAQELRLSNSKPGRLTWVAGVYYAKQNLNERYYSDFINIYGTYAA